MNDTAAATGASPTSAAERRVALRHQPAVNTVCRFDADGRQEAAIVWNISASGLCLLLPDPRPLGTVLTGFLETMEGDHARPVVLRVVHARWLEVGNCAIGARFDRPLTEDELRPFVTEE